MSAFPPKADIANLQGNRIFYQVSHVVEFIEFTRAIEAYAIRILRQEIKRYTASEN
jgi:hypothetical protein